MKRLFAIYLMAIAAMAAVNADTLTVRNLFKDVPDGVFPYLSRNNRLDFIDFIDSNMKAEVTNELGGKSIMTTLADDSLTIQMNEACSVDLLLLTAAQPVDSCSQVIVLVRTVGLQNQAQESEVEYYSVKWRRLEQRPALLSADQKRLDEHVKESNILKILQEKLNKD